jgi:hypothetical protein
MGPEPSRRKRKIIRYVTKLLPPGDTVHEYFSGRADLRWTTGATVAVVLFTVAAVIAAVNGTILFPGFVLILVVFNSVRPMRGVALTNQGAALIGVSAFHGRPSRVVTRVPTNAVAASMDGQTVELGGERITVNRKDRRLVGPALAANRTAAAAAPNWYQDPSGTGGLRYWDGTAWTEHLAPGSPSHNRGSSAPPAPSS